MVLIMILTFRQNLLSKFLIVMKMQMKTSQVVLILPVVLITVETQMNQPKKEDDIFSRLKKIV